MTRELLKDKLTEKLIEGISSTLSGWFIASQGASARRK